MPKLIYEEAENMNKLTGIKVIEQIINNLPKEKAPGPDGFTGKFYQILKKLIKPIFYNLFQTTEAEGKLSNTFYEAIVTLITKPKTLKENHRLISPINIDAILNKISANQIQQWRKRIIYHNQVRVFLVQHSKSS